MQEHLVAGVPLSRDHRPGQDSDHQPVAHPAAVVKGANLPGHLHKGARLGEGSLRGGEGEENVQQVLPPRQAGHCQGKAIEVDAVYLMGQNCLSGDGPPQDHPVFLLFHVQTASKVC